MTQVIIFTNANGGVSICTPSNEVSIEEVLAKDCPEGAIIVDYSTLPPDDEFFNAWELIDGKVIVNETKKQAIIDAKQQAFSTKESALSKLNALGLSQDEVKSLIG